VERAKGTMSFTAVIIACHVASADMCMQITDNRGPYDTAERCEVRIEEMIKDLIDVWTVFETPMLFKWTGCFDPTEQYKKGTST